MKKANILFLLLIVVYKVGTYGNVIIVDTATPTKICVKIANLANFPDIEIVGVASCNAVLSKPRVDIFDANTCIDVHKACHLSFYAVKKDYLKEKGIENINWKTDKNVMKSEMIVRASNYAKHHIQNVNVLEVNLIIAGFTENLMVMYVSSHTNKFNNGKADEIQEFAYPGSSERFPETLNLRKTF